MQPTVFKLKNVQVCIFNFTKLTLTVFFFGQENEKIQLYYFQVISITYQLKIYLILLKGNLWPIMGIRPVTSQEM
jgi:hypothetical protein